MCQFPRHLIGQGGGPLLLSATTSRPSELVTNNNLVPDCWGTVIETQVFLETEAS
jgi:hypothetical protein